MNEKEFCGKNIIQKYLDWLRENISYKDISDELISMDSPFLDVHNDVLRIYIKKVGNKYYLTDDGFISYDLECSGFQFTKKREEIFNMFAKGQGVSYNNGTGELFVTSTWDELPQKKKDLIQAMINIGDMFMLNQKQIKSIFFEDVKNYFKKYEISFVPDVFIQGKGFKQKIDFMIPEIGNHPPKIIELVNNPTKGFYEKFLFTFLDIRESESMNANAEPILMINDLDKNVKESDIEAIKNYNVKPMLWSERETSVYELKA